MIPGINNDPLYSTYFICSSVDVAKRTLEAINEKILMYGWVSAGYIMDYITYYDDEIKYSTIGEIPSIYYDWGYIGHDLPEIVPIFNEYYAIVLPNKVNDFLW